MLTVKPRIFGKRIRSFIGRTQWLQRFMNDD